MAKNTSISLGDHFEQFIDDQVDSGRFASVSEVVRASLRLMEERDIERIKKDARGAKRRRA